jgi:hypothetical protein
MDKHGHLLPSLFPIRRDVLRSHPVPHSIGAIMTEAGHRFLKIARLDQERNSTGDPAQCYKVARVWRLGRRFYRFFRADAADPCEGWR